MSVFIDGVEYVKKGKAQETGVGIDSILEGVNDSLIYQIDVSRALCEEISSGVFSSLGVEAEARLLASLESYNNFVYQLECVSEDSVEVADFIKDNDIKQFDPKEMV